MKIFSRLCGLFAVYAVTGIFAQVVLSEYEFIGEISRSRSDKSYIVELRDGKGNYWILKQSKGPRSRTYMKCLVEFVGAYICESMGVSCNHVEIISPKVDEYKFYKNRPATLHSLANGLSISRFPAYKGVRIKQRFNKQTENDRGFTKQVIESMARDPYFASLCAIDTFLGNDDRHRGNLYYDETANSFTAIDFGRSGEMNLALIAVENLKNMMRKGVVFSSPELYGLGIYYNTLKTLVDQYPPQKQIALLDSAVALMSLWDLDDRSRLEVSKFADKYKVFMNSTHFSSQALLMVLNEILKPSSKYRYYPH